ncbi:TIGR03617 family F420-dependent LLM class oxidoreductase [Nocardioides sp.]|uniref:TIGR03617 family F420-dependent LLM class oxidoreductase n=1 Tax=Nocardioides sp. TaxID=35761 RepID=UPI0031FE6985|nr:F420-dependent oxidoreductase [Nocardioides sp.]
MPQAATSTAPPGASGIALDIRLDAEPQDVAARAKVLADTGVAGLFTFEGAHDVFLPLAIAAATTNVQVMTNVAIALPRSPVHLAHAAYDLQLLSGGRFRLGLGSQVKAHIENRYGSSWQSPAAQMRESVLAVKAVLDSWQHGTPLDFRGEYTRHTLMPPTFSPRPNPFGVPPVLLGALGPVMTRTAAEVADGLLVMPFNSERHFAERTLPAIEKGLALRESDPSDFRVYPQSIIAMGRDDAELDRAVIGTRRLLAFYGSTPAYRPVLDVEGRAELQGELHILAAQQQFAGMGDLIDDELLLRLAVVGTPEECAEQLNKRFGNVTDRVCCYFPGYDPPLDQIRALVTATRASSARAPQH